MLCDSVGLFYAPTARSGLNITGPNVDETEYGRSTMVRICTEALVFVFQFIALTSS